MLACTKKITPCFRHSQTPAIVYPSLTRIRVPSVICVVSCVLITIPTSHLKLLDCWFSNAVKWFSMLPKRSLICAWTASREATRLSRLGICITQISQWRVKDFCGYRLPCRLRVPFFTIIISEWFSLLTEICQEIFFFYWFASEKWHSLIHSIRFLNNFHADEIAGMRRRHGYFNAVFSH